MTTPTYDLSFQNQGSLFLVHPHTDAARAWFEEHFTGRDDVQYLGRALVVEHRYVASLAQGALRDGLRVREDAG